MAAKKEILKNGAYAVVNLTGKVLSGLEKASGKLDPLIKVPFVGDTIAEVQDIVYMLNDYYRGEYKEVPLTAILGCMGIIGYLACPIDLIPDNIPILGMLDDAFIINIIIELCVDKELEKYRQWRSEKPASPDYVIEAETV